MMIVDREDNLDVLTVMVEVDESVFSDEIRKLDALRNKIAATLKTALGVSVKVKLVEPKSIQRSEGKAVRVIDNRDRQKEERTNGNYNSTTVGIS